MMKNIKGFIISDIFVSQDSSQLNVLISSLPFKNTLKAIAFYADTNDPVTNVTFAAFLTDQMQKIL